MAVGTQLSQLGISKLIPAGLSGGSLITIGMWLMGSLLFAGIIGAIAYYIYYITKFNQRVILYKKVNNTIIRVGIYKACYERKGKAGDKLLYVKGVKKFVPCPNIQMGANEWWFYERDDGEWINFSFGDFDEKMKKAGAFYVDFDMRMSRLGIEKNLNDRLMKQNFWDKYGGMIMNILSFMIIVICLVIFLWQLNKVMDALGGLIASMNGYIEAFNNILKSNGGVIQQL